MGALQPSGAEPPGLDGAHGRSTRVLAIRHGETDWNTEHRIQGQLDVVLNERGRLQAQRVAQALGGEDIDAIYSSDLARARATAMPLAAARGLPVRTDAGLRERAFGYFEGHTYAQIEQRFPEGSAAWRRRDPDFAPGGGESLVSFHRRCLATVVRLASAHPDQTVVIVAHGGVMDALYRAATRAGLQAPRTWQLSNAAIHRLLVADEGLMLVGWNDCQHLDGLAPGDGAS